MASHTRPPGWDNPHSGQWTPPWGKQHEEEPRAKELAYTISKMQGSVITRLDRHEKATQAGRNYLAWRETHRPLLQLTLYAWKISRGTPETPPGDQQPLTAGIPASGRNGPR